MLFTFNVSGGGKLSPLQWFPCFATTWWLVMITKNNWAHRGTGLDQPQIPTTPPLLTERQIKTRAAEAHKRWGDREAEQLCTTFTKTVIYYKKLHFRAARLARAHTHGKENVLIWGGIRWKSGFNREIKVVEKRTHGGVGGITQLRVIYFDNAEEPVSASDSRPKQGK